MNKKFKIIELPQFVGKNLQDVCEFVEKEYPGRLANEADREDFIASKPDLPDDTWCYFFGSILRSASGFWSVPYALWDGSEFSRNANWLSNGWHSCSRVVLTSELGTLKPREEKSVPLDPLSFVLPEIKIEIGSKKYKLIEI